MDFHKTHIIGFCMSIVLYETRHEFVMANYIYWDIVRHYKFTGPVPSNGILIGKDYYFATDGVAVDIFSDDLFKGCHDM